MFDDHDDGDEDPGARAERRRLFGYRISNRLIAAAPVLGHLQTFELEVEGIDRRREAREHCGARAPHHGKPVTPMTPPTLQAARKILADEAARLRTCDAKHFQAHELHAAIDVVLDAVARPGGTAVDVVNESGRKIGTATVDGVTVTGRITDEHAAAVLRANTGPRGVSVGYRVAVEPEPAAPAPSNPAVIDENAASALAKTLPAHAPDERAFDVCTCGRSRGSGVHDDGALEGHAFDARRSVSIPAVTDDSAGHAQATLSRAGERIATDPFARFEALDCRATCRWATHPEPEPAASAIGCAKSRDPAPAPFVPMPMPTTQTVGVLGPAPGARVRSINARWYGFTGIVLERHWNGVSSQVRVRGDVNAGEMHTFEPQELETIADAPTAHGSAIPPDALVAEMLPCPFCGAADGLFVAQAARVNHMCVCCVTCGARGSAGLLNQTGDGSREALANWNRRKSDLPEVRTVLHDVLSADPRRGSAVDGFDTAKLARLAAGDLIMLREADARLRTKIAMLEERVAKLQGWEPVPVPSGPAITRDHTPAATQPVAGQPWADSVVGPRVVLPLAGGEDGPSIGTATVSADGTVRVVAEFRDEAVARCLRDPSRRPIEARMVGGISFGCVPARPADRPTHPGPTPEPGQPVKVVTIEPSVTEPWQVTIAKAAGRNRVEVTTREQAVAQPAPGAPRVLCGEPSDEGACVLRWGHDGKHDGRRERGPCGLSVDGGTCHLPYGHGGHTQDGGCDRGPMSAAERRAALRADADRIAGKPNTPRWDATDERIESIRIAIEVLDNDGESETAAALRSMLREVGG